MKRLVLIVGACALVASGCSVSPGDKVNVHVEEWSIRVTPATATSGRVRFEIDSEGERKHNFALMLVDEPADLVKNPDGSLNLEGANRPIDEIEAFDPGHYIAMTPNLLAGDYLMVCTLVTDGVPHFSRGMVAKFHVDPRRKQVGN